MAPNQTYRTIDLRSDTVSQPTDEMRRAMFEAICGDDVYGEDSTVNELENRSAVMFGKEAGLFVPSGTMANLLAVMVHCTRRGTEIIVGDQSHIFLYEQGGAAQLAGVQLTTIPNRSDGTFCLKQLKRKIRGYDQHESLTTLVAVENTHNMCGGRVIPLDWLDDWTKLCKENGLKTHMDGARIFNAAIASKVPVDRIVRDIDSICFCLSKGLSAPVGSILLGSKEFIVQARRLRKALGGGMRQVGILAAAGLVALDKIVPTLDEDHRRTKRIAEAIHDMNSAQIQVDIANVETNILIVQMCGDQVNTDRFVKLLTTVTDEEISNGVCDPSGNGLVIKVSARDWKFARIVVYHQITDSDINFVIKKIQYCIGKLDGK